jgi:hypothetical protein
MMLDAACSPACGMQIAMQNLDCDGCMTLKLDVGPNIKFSGGCRLEGLGASNNPFIPPWLFCSFKMQFQDERSKNNEQKHKQMLGESMFCL